MKSNHRPLSNLSELEEPQEAPDDQGVLNYTKNLSTYVSDIASTFLGFARDAEASDLVLGKKLAGFASKLRRPMEFWSRTKTWSGNMVQSMEPSETQWN